MPCENRRKGYNRSMKEKYYSDCIKVLDEVGKVVIGKDDCIRSVMAAVLAEGHILIDDVPEIKTYDVILRVKPEKIGQIHSDTINGKKCLIIPMEDNEHAAVNGINTTI